MSDKNDLAGKPILEDGTDPFFVKHIATSQYNASFYPKIRADRNVGYRDTMLMVDLLLHKFEAYYEANRDDPRLLCMRNLFVEPDQGTQLRNVQTNEIYTVTDTPRNPITNRWEGLVRIDAITPPSKLLAEKLEFVDDNNRVRFSPHSPPDISTDNQTTDEMHEDVGPIRPTITYSLVRKEPGSINGQPFGRQKQYKPMLRERLRSQSATGTGRSVEIYGQWFDVIVEFVAHTTDNRSADLLVDWFEEFVRQYTWVLKLNGVQELLYWQRLRDATVTKWRQDLKSRTVQYFFRIEELLPEVVKDINKIDTCINVEKEILNASQRWIAGNLVTGQLTYNQYNDYFVDASGNYLFGDLTLNDGNLS